MLASTVMIILLFIESRLNFINIPLNSTFKSSINYEYIVYRNENPISCFLEFLVSLSLPIMLEESNETIFQMKDAMYFSFKELQLNMDN